jgi:hypothetical protein
MIYLEIPKNDNLKVVIQKQLYNSKESVDIRTFFKPKEDSNWLPTKKGVSFSLERLPEVIAALQKMEDNI